MTPSIPMLARKPVHLNLNIPKNGTRVMSLFGKKTPVTSHGMLRNVSVTSAFQTLSLAERQSDVVLSSPQSPSKLPRRVPVTPVTKRHLTPPERALFTPHPFPQSATKSGKKKPYLTRDSNLVGWDPEEQYGNMERMYQDVCSHYKEAMEDNSSFREANTVYKSAMSKLEEDRSTLTESIITLRTELETTKFRLSAAERETQDARRDSEEEVESVRRQFRLEIESIRQSHRDELERMRSDHREEVRDVKRRFEDELETERAQRIQAMSQVSTQGALEKQRQQMELETKDREIMSVRAEADRINAGLERERLLNDDLRQNLAAAGTNANTMEIARQALQAKIDYLESDSKSQSEAYATMERRMNEAIDKAIECEEKLRREETLRRKLHNQVQELKGNIRVFCRVRPSQSTSEAEERAKISFPDPENAAEIEVRGPEETSSLGKVTTKSHPFNFDRVFNPESDNAEIFDEISQLIQSALDGYNVCIFAYGQTGSGKTYTMSSDDGMIPRALRQIYSTSKELESRGWRYTMEGSFIEVYNEELRDLLGKDGDNEKGATKKHEVIHDKSKNETTITEVTTLDLDSQDQVEGILERAMARRSVAATKSNERSSRSHSVFILKLQGINTITGETSKGTLNLVDLAGSERIKESKVEGTRLKETQNINKSLSCLGDVIGALGQQTSAAGFNPRASVNGDGTNGHIPYRNSKLTYLLQFSLGGNSKTLMFVMVAPEKKHLQETLTSLKFADKVSRTKIGVARKSR
jgi:kinesin family member C1